MVIIITAGGRYEMGVNPYRNNAPNMPTYPVMEESALKKGNSAKAMFFLDSIMEVL